MEICTAKAEPRLRDQMRSLLTMKRYKRSTIESCLGWCYQFAAFHKRDPRELRELEINQFLTFLARRPAETIKSPIDL